MTKQRKNYSPEFKRKAIAMVVEQGQAAAEIARSLDIDAGNLRRGVRKQDENRMKKRKCPFLAKDNRL